GQRVSHVIFAPDATYETSVHSQTAQLRRRTLIGRVQYSCLLPVRRSGGTPLRCAGSARPPAVGDRVRIGSLRKFSLAALLVGACCAPAARGVIVAAGNGTQNSTAPAGLSYWNNVGY